jgi:hypothetical protein
MRLLATVRLLRWACFWSALLGPTLALQQSALAQAAPDVVCIVPLASSTGAVSSMRRFPGGETLIAARNGLFLTHDVAGKLTVVPAGANTDFTASMYGIYDLQSESALIGSAEGLFLAHEINGKVTVSRDEDTKLKPASILHVFQGAGALVRSDNRLLQVREAGGKIITTFLTNLDFSPTALIPLLSGELLIFGRNAVIAREVNGEIVVVPVGPNDGVGPVRVTRNFADDRILIGTEFGLFQAQVVGGRLIVTSVQDARPILSMHALASDSILIGSREGLLLAREINNQVKVTSLPTTTGVVFWVGEFTRQASLITATNGIFLASQVNSEVTIAHVSSTYIGRVFSSRKVPDGLLIRGNAGTFLAQMVRGQFSVERIGEEASSNVEFPGGRVLLETTEGLFISRNVNGKIIMERVAGGDFGGIASAHQISDDRVLIGSSRGLSLSLPTSLSDAQVDIRQRRNLDGAVVEPGRDYSLHFTIMHGCAPVGDKLGLKVRVTAPGEASPRPSLARIERVTPG